ncbi:AGAP006975-PA [Anopheles gambiae str. PEST]|uniref:AGAP006975-PA n=4 Tax=gambiae species complex TaxID=44542 RepID=A7URU9_ANOGA|nr:AGAP006975-PA [Anopheles gambiae str. PEST]
MVTVIDGLVNATKMPLGLAEADSSLLALPNRSAAAGLDAADAIVDASFDLLFVTLVFFIYLVQIVRFLTLPLRERLEQGEEAQRLKRICMIIVKAILSGSAGAC